MKSALAVLVLGLIFAPAAQQCRAQGEAALPFLLIPPSPQGDGMGGIIGSTISDDPLAMLANPGQLGLASLDHYFSVSYFPSATSWLPALHATDLNYRSSALSAGLKLNRFFSLPFELTAGVGYSNVTLNLGTFGISVDDPTVLNYFSAEEHSNNLSFGIGVDYYLRLGLGYTLKMAQSNLAPFDVQRQGREGVAEATTYDIGMIGQLPVIGVLDRITGDLISLSGLAEPLLDISFGYARSNLGDDFVPYIDPGQADPLPRTARLGLSYKAGVTRRGPAANWELFSFTLAREAEDLLVERFPAPTDSFGNAIASPPPPQYVDGNGAIQFVKNVVLGEGNGRVTLRKGWQLNFGELFFLRGGSVTGRGVEYTTSGFGVHLGGVLKLLDNLSPAFSSTPFMGFVVSHIDIRYDHASSDYNDPYNPNNGVTFNALSVVVK